MTERQSVDLQGHMFGNLTHVKSNHVNVPTVLDRLEVACDDYVRDKVLTSNGTCLVISLM